MPQSDSPLLTSVLEVATTLIEERESVASKIERFEVRAKSAKDFIDQSTAEAIEPLVKRREFLDSQLADHLTRHRRVIRRNKGRTVTLPPGVVKWRIIPRSLQVPRDVGSVIDKLLKMRGGKKYYAVEIKLDRRALAAAPPRTLRHLGLTNYRHEQLSVTPTATDGTALRKPVELWKRRYPAAPYAKD